MKKLLFISCLLFLTSISTIAQLDNPLNNSIKFDQNQNDVPAPVGYKLPSIKKPRFSNTDGKNPNTMRPLPEEDEDNFNMSKDDGLLEYKTNKAPKYFTKDKEAKEEYGRDQYLGDLLTTAGFVNVVYRDHEYVDGDRVRIYVNGDIVKSSVSLSAGFNGFTFPLQPGFNKVEFQALNQGSSGPNTAELRIFNDEGDVISANQWNLTTGRKAMVTIIKE